MLCYVVRLLHQNTVTFCCVVVLCCVVHCHYVGKLLRCAVKFCCIVMSHCIVALLHRNIVTICFYVALLHRNIALRCYVITLLHCYVVTLCCCAGKLLCSIPLFCWIVPLFYIMLLLMTTCETEYLLRCYELKPEQRSSCFYLQEQKHVEESSGREVKKVSAHLDLLFHHLFFGQVTSGVVVLPVKVRKARNRRQEWNLMAYDKELRPDARVTPSPYHTSDGSMSPDR